MDFSGKVVTAKQLTGRNLNTSRNAPYGIQGKAYLNAVFSDGTIHTAATFEFNSGPYANGPTPNNSYEALGAVPTNESGMLNNDVQDGKFSYRIIMEDRGLECIQILIHLEQRAALV